jgi:hypothetical protein
MRPSPIDFPRPCAHAAAGFTIAEMTVACALLSFVLAVAMNSNMTIHTLIRDSETRRVTAERSRELFWLLRIDLAATSMAADPVTDNNRFVIEAAEHGGERLRVQTVTGASLGGGAVTPRWSPWITWEIDDAGTVTRTEEGTSAQVVARGIRSFDFEVMNGRVFSVTCAAIVDQPGDDDAQEITVTEIVLPTH